ncbi:MAG: hypothetical protein MUF72_10025 [Elainella sp. Prado103]|jgi:hypothetical protein|nr:hypothetical protein [Elainella sp. Prado103]
MADRQSSAAARIFKAKLQLLKRPMVWGAGLVLFLPLLFLADYWLHPERFLSRPLSANPPVNPELEETATATIGDPDSGEVTDPSSLLETPNPTLEPEPDSFLLQTDLLDSLLAVPILDKNANRSAQAKSEAQVITGQEVTVDAAVPAPSSLFSSPSLFSLTQPSASASPLPGSPGSALSSSATPASQPTRSTNPLQSALDRSRQGQTAEPSSSTATPPTVNPTDSNFTAANSTDANLANPNASNASAIPNLYGQATPQSGNPPQSFTDPRLGSSRLNYPLYVPRTSPNPGTTGYTLPPALRSPTNSANPAFTQIAPAIQPQPLPGYRSPTTNSIQPSYPLPAYTLPSPQVQASPFSVPRMPPGQHIGGGEINTFSNP